MFMAIVLPAMLAYVIFPAYTYQPDTTSCEVPVDGRISLQSCHMQSETFGSTLSPSQECRTWEMPVNASVLGFSVNSTCEGCAEEMDYADFGSADGDGSGSFVDFAANSADADGGVQAFADRLMGGKNWTENGWAKNYCECVSDCGAVNEMDNSRRAFFIVATFMASWFVIAMLNVRTVTRCFVNPTGHCSRMRRRTQPAPSRGRALSLFSLLSSLFSLLSLSLSSLSLSLSLSHTHIYIHSHTLSLSLSRSHSTYGISC